MPRLQDTAYPRLKSVLTPRDLAAAYTPTADEGALARRAAKGPAAQLGFLVLLKTFQRLGQAAPVAPVPRPIVEHIAQRVGLPTAALTGAAYDRSGTRQRHLTVLRDSLRVRPYGPAARRAMLHALAAAARTKHELEDLINVAIEELVRQRFELPAFDTLNRAARRVRATLARALDGRVSQALSGAAQARLDALFVADPATLRTPWNDLKADAGTPTLTHLKELVARQRWLAAQDVGAAVLADVPAVQVQHFAAEAKTLDAARMLGLEPRKRATLAGALLAVPAARALDDLGELFVRRLQRIHSAGKEALERSRATTVDRTNGLVTTLRDPLLAHQEAGTVDQRFSAMDAVLAPRHDELLEACEAHMAHAGNNSFPFLWRASKSHRATLFGLLAALTLRSTSQDTALEAALRFLRAHAPSSGQWLRTTRPERTGPGPARQVPLLDLTWVPDGWWRLLTGASRRDGFPDRVDRRHFEVCDFSQLMWERKAGDLCIVGSDAFADEGAQLVSWEASDAGVAADGEVAGLPVDGPGFVAHVRDWLEGVARARSGRSRPTSWSASSTGSRSVPGPSGSRRRVTCAPWRGSWPSASRR